MKIGVISLGCAKNLVDTENVLGMLKQADQEITTSYDEAEAIIVSIHAVLLKVPRWRQSIRF
jgi:ribosomal protein S12 methylthiotransferase